MLGLVALQAVAQTPVPPDASEEVIVWADPFARWDRRWHTVAEVEFWQPLRVLAYEAHETRIDALQVRAVFSCRNDGGSERAIEALCTIDDLSLTARSARDRIGPHSERILEQLDATLTGAAIQLQANAQGSVTNFDLEGVTKRNRRAALRHEWLRQLVIVLSSPFHLTLPDTVHPGARWFDRNAPLMVVPHTRQRASSGSEVIHAMHAAEDGSLVVRTVGRAHSQVSGSYVSHLHFDMSLEATARFERDSGVLSHRTWHVQGTSTPSSPTITPFTYTHRGWFQEVAPTDRPDVGSTDLLLAEDWVPMPR